MFYFQGPPFSRGSALTRRAWLQIGGLGLLGTGLPELLWAEQTAASDVVKGTPNSCILIYLFGGPAHHDLWDMKPLAPAEIRGEFKPIQTNVPGIQLSEHLPRLAHHADKFSIIRSVTHHFKEHNPGASFALTGHPPNVNIIQLEAQPTDHPGYGAVVKHFTRPAGAMPVSFSLPAILKDGVYLTPGQFGGWLGRHNDPFFIVGDPNAEDFHVPGLAHQTDGGLPRLESRKRLLDRIDHALAALEREAAARAMNRFQEQAISLITSPLVKRALDLSQEPDRIRARYGRNTYGQSVLLARRLVEAGTRLVTIHWSPDLDDYTWDTHSQNFKKLKEMLLPHLDLALSALLGDLADRGRLNRTLVVCLGEFGRTPKVNRNAGRDHWPDCYSVVLGGGGIHGGRLVGRSDKTGAHPADRPVSPQDVAATVYSALGIKFDTEVRDTFGRPMRIVDQGMRIGELF